jgi:23S rRNA pseudouridine1911/1915/1917 synthase
VSRKSRGKKAEGRKEEPFSRPVIRFADSQVVVVEKPAGLTTMRHPEEAAEFGRRARRFLPDTLADLLPNLLDRYETTKTRKPQAAGNRFKRKHPSLTRPLSPHRFFLRAVHRLDKDTSGLVVFARTPEAERHLGRQFRTHSIERRYLAVTRGRAKPGKIETWLIRDRGDGRRGSSTEPGGQRAITYIRLLEDLGDFTLIECRLETGRTHQVRIHLGEVGTPLCGERVYDRPIHGRPLPDLSQAPRLALHAARLEIDHPTSGRRMIWTSPLPEDLALMVRRLRKKAQDKS